ncbi:hypothetical protein ACNKHK_18930 [Shigella flexneri]
MPLRLSATVMTTAATSVKWVLSSATTWRWLESEKPVHHWRRFSLIS